MFKYRSFALMSPDDTGSDGADTSQDAASSESQDDTPTVEELQAQLAEARRKAEKAEAAKNAAEKAISESKKAEKLKRQESQSAEETLREKLAEIEEERKELRLSKSRATAKEVLAGKIGLEGDALTDFIDSYALEDTEGTKNLSEAIVGIVQRYAENARKQERDAMVKSMPEIKSRNNNSKGDKFLESIELAMRATGG